MCCTSMSMVRATNVASAARASDSGRTGVSNDPPGLVFDRRAEPAGGRILALRQAVDFVVEQQNLDVHVPPQGVDQVVAADREAVAVAGDDPHLQVGVGEPQAGGERRGAAVDGVEAVGVHVVREAAGAADARDERHLLAWHADRGERLLHLGEDRVVPATGAPADLLVGLEVVGFESRESGRCGHVMSVIGYEVQCVIRSPARGFVRDARFTPGGAAANGRSLQHLLDRRLDLGDQERLALDLAQRLGGGQIFRPQAASRAARRSVPGTRIFLNRLSTAAVFFGIGLR